MTVLVTGASGHVGANLVSMLLAEGESVRCLVHRTPLPYDAPQVKGNLHGAASLRAAMEGVDEVIHLAARISIAGDPDGQVHATNVVGAGNVAEAALAAGVDRFVHVSSVHAFDLRNPGPVTEESAPSGAGTSAYDRSKAEVEAAVRARVEQGLPAVIVNPTGVIGPGDLGPSRMGKVFLDLAAGRLPALVSGGFDFVDVRDVCRGILAARTKGVVGEGHLLGGAFHTVPEIARAADAALGRRRRRLVLPSWLALAGVPFARWAAKGREPEFTAESIGALRHGKHVDHSKAARVLGHRPRPLDETVRDVYADFEARGVLEVR